MATIALAFQQRGPNAWSDALQTEPSHYSYDLLVIVQTMQLIGASD